MSSPPSASFDQTFAPKASMPNRLRTGCHLTAPSRPGNRSSSSRCATSYSVTAPQLLQHDRVDGIDPVHAFLEILYAGPPGQCVREVAVVAERRKAHCQLAAQLLVDRDPLLARRLAEERVVQPVEAAELLDRSLMVVDAEIDEDVRQPCVPALRLHDEQRRRLLSPAVPACRLRSGETVDETIGERPAGGLEERALESRD